MLRGIGRCAGLGNGDLIRVLEAVITVERVHITQGVHGIQQTEEGISGDLSGPAGQAFKIAGDDSPCGRVVTVGD